MKISSAKSALPKKKKQKKENPSKIEWGKKEKVSPTKKLNRYEKTEMVEAVTEYLIRIATLSSHFIHSNQVDVDQSPFDIIRCANDSVEHFVFSEIAEENGGKYLGKAE